MKFIDKLRKICEKKKNRDPYNIANYVLKMLKNGAKRGSKCFVVYRYVLEEEFNCFLSDDTIKIIAIILQKHEIRIQVNKRTLDNKFDSFIFDWE